MRGLAQFVLAAATLVHMASAIPYDKRAGIFSVQQKANEKFVANGPAAYAKAYLKFGKTIPDALASASGNDGSVSAAPQPNDSEYLCPVDIGGQSLTLDFDTGSSDLWVFSTELPSSDQQGHNVFDSSQSSTFQSLSGATWQIKYQDQSGASGDVGTDTVTIGGTVVQGQAVELASQVSSSFSQGASDGLLGLAFSSINTVSPTKQKTFFDNAQSSLSQALFTADLKYHAAGTYDFGTIDDSKHTGSITYADVDNSKGFWQFTSSGYGVGSGSFQSSSFNAIADTGTTLLLVPDDAVTAYYQQVQGAQNEPSLGGYIFPCSATLPDFTLGIGSYQAVVPGKYINYATASGSNCFGGIQSSNGIGVSIFGDIFLKSQFVVFDQTQGTPRVGFAPKST